VLSWSRADLTYNEWFVRISSETGLQVDAADATAEPGDEGGGAA
jgi:hypothetical protein